MIAISFIWIVTALGLWVVTLVLPGVRAKTLGGLIMAALVLGLVNTFIRPVLWLLTLPLTVLTFGLFALLEWLMMGSVHWTYTEQYQGGSFI